MPKKTMVFIMNQPAVAVGIGSLEFLLVFAVMHRKFLKGDDTVLIGVDAPKTDVTALLPRDAQTVPHQKYSKYN